MFIAEFDSKISCIMFLHNNVLVCEISNKISSIILIV